MRPAWLCKLRNHWRRGERSLWREADEEVKPGITKIGRWICNWCGSPVPPFCECCGRRK